LTGFFAAAPHVSTDFFSVQAQREKVEFDTPFERPGKKI